MKTYTLFAENIKGTDGVWVREGNHTFEFDGILRFEEKEEKYHFVVNNVEEVSIDDTIWSRALNAINFVLFITGGHLDKYNVTNIKQYS